MRSFWTPQSGPLTRKLKRVSPSCKGAVLSVQNADLLAVLLLYAYDVSMLICDDAP